jgi:hypothetical protein
MVATALRKVQVGQETTWGTGVAATAILMGITDVSFDVADEVEVLQEMGHLNPSSIAYLQTLHAEGNITARATYEDIMYFAKGVFGAPSSAGTYTWTYAAPTTAAPTLNGMTLEFFDPTGAPYEADGVLFNGLTISGEAGGMWQVQSPLLGETIVAAAMTTALSERTVEAIRCGDTVLYMDTWGGTMGTTSVGATLISFSAEITPNRHLKQFCGSLTPENYGEGVWTGTLTTVLEFNSTAKALVDAMLAPALLQRQIQIKASSSSKNAAIQWAGTKSSGTTLFSDRDGNMTVELKWAGTYHATYGNWCKVIVTNAVQTMP